MADKKSSIDSKVGKLERLPYHTDGRILYMTFFFSCDAVFGEGAPCIAVLSKDIAYSDDGYRELVMDEQMYENVLSAASEVTSNAIVGGF